jgi:UDP-N-acetyl-2-amino-2-deoxyglucuronate dehydrogenase
LLVPFVLVIKEAMPMFLSIFTDELAMDITEGLPLLKSWGLDRCDLRGRVFGKGCERLDEAQLAELKKLLADSGFTLGALQSSLCKVHLPDADRQRQEMEKLEGLIRAADAMECRLVRSFNFWQPRDPEEKGALATRPDMMQQVLDMFGPIAQRAKEAGLVLAFENCGQTVREVLALVDALGVREWGLAWDCMNTWEGEEREDDEVEFLVKCAEQSRMVHVKAASILPELGRQPLPWARILKTCLAAGMTGPVSVETHNPGKSPLSNVEASQKCVALVRQAWPAAAPGDIREAARPVEVRTITRPYEHDPVRFAVVGLGMGHNNAGKVVRACGAQLATVCDLRAERAERSGKEYAVPHTTDTASVMADPNIEVVYVVTETGNHAAVALQAVAAGKHVLTTKPMEASVDACDRMIRAAEAKGVLLGVDFDKRFDSHTLSLRQAVADGFFGRLLAGTCALRILRKPGYFAESGGWRGTKKLDGGGVLSNQAIHLIDMLAFCVGIPAQVRCDLWTQDHDIEAEDLGCATWIYENGCVIQFMATSSFPQSAWHEHLELHGTAGAMAFSRGGPAPAHALWFSEGKWREQAPVPVESEWLNVADNFAAAVRTGAALMCDGREGRRSQSILHAMYESAERGGERVDVQPEL